MDTVRKWVPEPHHLSSAHVMDLCARLGFSSYSELLDYSVRKPDAYWAAALEYLGIQWFRKPHGYVDISAGIEFPKWFPGGKLNWVETALAFGSSADTFSQTAVVAEQEDGSVATLAYGELAAAV